MTEIRRLAAAALACALLATPAAGQPAAPASHLGVASCASGVCHGSAEPLAATAVLQNEYVTWSHFDPHSRAFRVLLEPESVAIARRLRIVAPERADECLDCHAEQVAPALRGPRFQADDGIGCEACHGASSRWIASHDDRHRTSHADSLALGLVALEQPGVRAARCSGCHVGSASRFASHALMAAGHPRLSFELDTFTELWRTSGGREHYRVDDDYRRRKAAAPAVETWLVGLVGQARRVAAITASEVAAGGVLPDFALFNCYSCHRSMKLRRWRDAPGLAPGSLRVQDSALVLLAAAMDALDPPAATGLRAATLDLHRGAARGLPALREAAAALDPLLAALGDRLAGRRYGPAEQRALLESLLRAADRGELPDYAAAEQAAMAVTLLLAETGRIRELEAQVDALFRDLAEDERYDAQRFARLLGRISPSRDP